MKKEIDQLEGDFDPALVKQKYEEMSRLKGLLFR